MQTGGYFQCPTPTRVRSPTPPPQTPSPEAVERAANPIALRYWNQCVEKNTDTSTSSSKSSSVSPRGPEVVRVLSSAGSGIKRNNEVSEARNNINRFITIDQVKKKDADRVARQRSLSQSRAGVVEDNVHNDNRSYNSVKEEQIRLSQARIIYRMVIVEVQQYLTKPNHCI